MLLATNAIHSLCMAQNNEHLVLKKLKMKLSCEAMDLLKLGTSTQKCDSLNRSISVSLSKNVNFSRNVTWCIASTIHRCNHGVQDSAERKLAAVGVQLLPRTKSALEGMQKAKSYKCIKTLCGHPEIKINMNSRYNLSVTSSRRKNLDRMPFSAFH